MDQEPRFRPKPVGYATKAIHSAQHSDQWSSRCVVPPIVNSTVYEQSVPEETGEYFYSRVQNPTRNVLEKCLADLDNAKFGFAYSCGNGATTAAFSLLQSNDHLICCDQLYGGTYGKARRNAEQYNIAVDFVDLTDANNLKKAIKKNTKMVLIESPTNPALIVLDIRAISEIIKSYTDQKIFFVIDNTFLTSYFQRPLELGVDLVIYSLTKYINGHSDVTMGSAVTNCPKIAEELKIAQKGIGLVPSPFDCFLVLRSLRTLTVRLEQHSKAALAIARFLEGNPCVEKVMHPGLPSHPQHEIAVKQSYGHSGIMAFYIKGNFNTAKRFCAALKLVLVAGSLGGPETVVSLPVFTSHTLLSEEERKRLGITRNLIRLSVGLEDVECLIEDMAQALEKSQH